MSLADELARLHELRLRGALNDDEFALAKAKILYAPEGSEAFVSAPVQPQVLPQAATENWWSRGLERLRELKKSDKDSVIGGVCGGLGEQTGVPSWAWRALFCGAFFIYGAGLITYGILYFCLPDAETVPVAEAVEQPAGRRA